MNTKRLLPILALFLLAVSCQTTESFTFHNDVYTRSTDRQYQAQREQRAQAQNERENRYNDNYIEEEYYDNEPGVAQASYDYADELDMYDFYYTSRIRRFHTHVSYGWGFYDPYFTNMFWYTHMPSTWGISIYLGHSWWWPSPFWRPWMFDWGWYSWGWNWGWGWGWHSPWRFGGPWGGFSPGFNPWFCGGHYHNRFDLNNSFTFGHRNTIGPSSGGAGTRNVFGTNTTPNSSRMVTRSSRETFSERYDNMTREGTSSREMGATTRQTETGTGTTTRQTETRPGATGTTGTTTRQTETRPGTTGTTGTTTRQTETRPGTTSTTGTTTRPSETPATRPPTTPSTRQDTYNSGFRPDNSRSTPTHTPSSTGSSGSGFSAPSSGRSSGGGSAPSGGSSGGSSRSGGSSGGTRR